MVLSGEAWYDAHNFKVEAFGRTHGSLADVYKTYKDEDWTTNVDYVNFVRYTREYNVSPEEALLFKEREIKIDKRIGENITHKYDFLYPDYKEDFTNVVDLKIEILNIIKFIQEEIIKDSSPKNLRNLNIFTRRLFHGQSLTYIGEHYNISKERVRQICKKYYHKLERYLRRNKINLSFDIDKILFNQKKKGN